MSVELLVDRRRVLALAAPLALSITPISALAKAIAPNERRLAFRHLHTGETLETVYWVDGTHDPRGLTEIDRILRDHRSGDVAEIDRNLLDMLFVLHRRMDSEAPFEIISGYRSPRTNRMLRRQGRGVAKKSLHMLGKAIDIRLPDRKLRDLYRTARAMKKGGVGYYGRSNFIHIDTGRVRYW